MSYEVGLLVVGIPVIAWLAVRAVQRMQAIRERIADVQDDMKRNPQSPYIALSELFNPPPAPSPPKERTRGKRKD